MSKKVRMVIEFELNEDVIREKGMTTEGLLEAIDIHNHDTIDGFEIYPALEECDLCSDFFLCDPTVVSKEIVAEGQEVNADDERLSNLLHELDGALAHDPDAVPAIEAAILDAVCDIEDGVDAVFLPGKIHGCEDELYIIYYNASANDEKGCFEIEIIDYERILKLYEEVKGDAEQFFALLPDLFHGEWLYCNSDAEGFEDYAKAYAEADFIVGRDGGDHEEMMFLVNWAKKRAGMPVSSKITKNMIAAGYKAGIVTLCESPNEDGVACRIGDNWFYFGGETAEGCTVEEYKKNVPEEDIVDEIFNVLNDFRISGEELKDEYLYYAYYLQERGIA